MTKLQRILIVEDSADDAELVVRTLKRGGCELTYERVDTRETMRAALVRGGWDLVIADFSMPHFDGLEALTMLRDSGLDVPFILVSGTVGEKLAVQAMKRGADDYVLKSNLARLPRAVERELRDYEIRAERNRAQERYHNLVDRIPVGVFSINRGGEILEANPWLIEMLGFSDGASLKGVNVVSMVAARRARPV